MDATPDSLHEEIWKNKWKGGEKGGKINDKQQRNTGRLEEERSKRVKEVKWKEGGRTEHRGIDTEMEKDKQNNDY